MALYSPADESAWEDGVLAALRGEECPLGRAMASEGYAYGLDLAATHPDTAARYRGEAGEPSHG